MDRSATTFGTPLRWSQNNGGAQMTAMNMARKKGTRMAGWLSPEEASDMKSAVEEFEEIGEGDWP